MATATDTLRACLELLRRTQPDQVERDASALAELRDDIADDLWGSVDLPLKVQAADSGEPFLGCEFNMDGDSYRNPWTNQYEPAVELEEDEEEEDAPYAPTGDLRALEQDVNEVWKAYTQGYYGRDNCVTSAYVWPINDEDEESAADADVEHGRANGVWHGTHVVEVRRAEDEDSKHEIKVTSTVLLTFEPKQVLMMREDGELEDVGDLGNVRWAGSMNRQTVSHASFTWGDRVAWLEAVGKQIEAMESTLWGNLSGINLPKTGAITESVRRHDEGPEQVDSHLAALRQSILARSPTSSA